jgi:ubiquinone/menaquinone biosynthesis C-methylase UbiE
MEGSMKSKDLFSKVARGYAAFRPSYPRALFACLSRLVEQHQCAWDCATGNGQAAVMLADYFDHVFATDQSRNQTSHGTPHPKITYSVATAENSGLKAKSIDLITVAQAFHWFDRDAFVKEVKRVAKGGAVLALFCYGLCTINKETDAIVHYLYENVLGPFWEPERKLVEENYDNIHLPFEKLMVPNFDMFAYWTFEHLIGYLRTWSALISYQEKIGTDPLQPLLKALFEAFHSDEKRKVSWVLKPKVFSI